MGNTAETQAKIDALHARVRRTLVLPVSGIEVTVRRPGVLTEMHLTGWLPLVGFDKGRVVRILGDPEMRDADISVLSKEDREAVLAVQKRTYRLIALCCEQPKFSDDPECRAPDVVRVEDLDLEDIEALGNVIAELRGVKEAAQEVAPFLPVQKAS